MKSVLRFVAIYLVLSAVLGLLALVSSFPARPTSWLGWLALFALVLPVTLAGEFMGELLHRNRIAQAVELRTQSSGLCWLRIGYLFVAAVFVAAVVVAVKLLFTQGA